MFKKLKLIIVILFIILIIILGCIASKNQIIQNISYNIRKRAYGDPINQENGIINNEFFGIDSNGNDAEHTTKGINEAILYASANNIGNIKLEKGTYLINGTVDDRTYKDEKKGIILQSNINLDLNRFTINT